MHPIYGGYLFDTLVTILVRTDEHNCTEHLMLFTTDQSVLTLISRDI